MQIKYVKTLSMTGAVVADTYNLRTEKAEAGGL